MSSFKGPLAAGVLVLSLMALPWAKDSSAAALADPPLYQTMNDDYPGIDVVTTVFLGDRMLRQRTGKYTECIVPKFSHQETKPGGWVLSIRANEPLCKLTPGARYYYSTYMNGVSPNAENRYDISYQPNRNGTVSICLSVSGLNGMCVRDKTAAAFENRVVFLSETDSLQRTIEYVGKSGSVLKFLYSEYKDGMAREAFNREFQIDLADGPVAAYRGAIFEIIEADNATIKYKVARNFQ